MSPKHCNNGKSAGKSQIVKHEAARRRQGILAVAVRIAA